MRCCGCYVRLRVAVADICRSTILVAASKRENRACKEVSSPASLSVDLRDGLRGRVVETLEEELAFVFIDDDADEELGIVIERAGDEALDVGRAEAGDVDDERALGRHGSGRLVDLAAHKQAMPPKQVRVMGSFMRNSG